MAAVQRRDEPRKFLDASLVPLERALRARADELEERHQMRAADGSSPSLMKLVMAAEFRVLADELHHW